MVVSQLYFPNHIHDNNTEWLKGIPNMLFFSERLLYHLNIHKFIYTYLHVSHADKNVSNVYTVKQRLRTKRQGLAYNMDIHQCFWRRHVQYQRFKWVRSIYYVQAMTYSANLGFAKFRTASRRFYVGGRYIPKGKRHYELVSCQGCKFSLCPAHLKKATSRFLYCKLTE